MFSQTFAVHEDFTFDERDFVLAERNETRKIWTEKFLGITPPRAEAEHFALYQFYASALTESFKRRGGGSFVSERSFDPSVESRNLLIDYSSRLDCGETFVGLGLKSGPFGTAIPALEKRNGHLILHLLSMSPVPEKDKRTSSAPGSMFLSWFSAGLVDQLFRGLQDPLAAIAFHTPALNEPRFCSDPETPVTAHTKDLAMAKAQDVVLACFRNIAASPFSPPATGNVYPVLDYSGLSRNRITKAVVIQETIAKSWGSFSKIFATQSEDAEKLDRHQLARAHALECVGSPYEPEFSKIVAFASASVPLGSGLNEKDGKIAPPPGTTPVLERFAWEDEEGLPQSRTLNLFHLAKDHSRVFSLKFEIERLQNNGYALVAADTESEKAGSVLGFDMCRAASVISNGHYHHPAAILEPDDLCGMIRMLGGNPEGSCEPASLRALVGLATGLLAGKDTALNGELKTLYRAEEARLGKLCDAVFRLRDLAQERAHASAGLAPKDSYTLDDRAIRWNAYEPASVSDAIKSKRLVNHRQERAAGDLLRPSRQSLHTVGPVSNPLKDRNRESRIDPFLPGL